MNLYLKSLNHFMALLSRAYFIGYINFISFGFINILVFLIMKLGQVLCVHCLHTDSIVRMLKFKFIKIKTKVIFIFLFIFTLLEEEGVGGGLWKLWPQLAFLIVKALRKSFDAEASAS